MYNSLLGRTPLEERVSDTADASWDGAPLNVETCAICSSDIVLGPAEAVSRMQIPVGEQPRHFACGRTHLPDRASHMRTVLSPEAVPST